MKYVVESWAATSCNFEPAPKDVPTLKAAREEVKRRLGVRLLRSERRVKRDGAIEAYRVIGIGPPGLGGVQIRKVLESKPRGGKEARTLGSPLRLDASEVLEAVRVAARKDRHGGTLLSVREVRSAIALPKERFDRAMLLLSSEGKVSLHQHDHPYGLSQRDRDELVTDGKRFFIGVALRKTS